MRNRFAIWLEQQWYRIGPWHVLLLPLSWLFRLLSSCRRLAYRLGILKSYPAAVPLIVVGNISVGGTGKTPLVLWLVEQLRLAGYNPGIISRGYGGRGRVPVAVTAGSAASEAGDEPVLLAKRARCPVWAGSDRVATQQALLGTHPECNVIVSDDGLQHYRMRRDIELVVVDGMRGLGNGQLIPAGPLREPESRLSKVDAVIYNGTNGHGADFNMHLKAGGIRNLLDSGQELAVEALAGKRIHAIAGIGHPQRFFQQLRGMGLDVEEHAFPDHHPFQAADLQFADEDIVLMTEKDAVKCVGFARQNWWYLPVDAVVENTLADYIIRKLRK
ncbi:tetraacyldisaccharide 4'-kinase [Methylophilaceae bacterium]|nr:tetraacyldisaccharide 4'-kinase [Methylophilaceae bacterium]